MLTITPSTIRDVSIAAYDEGTHPAFTQFLSNPGVAATKSAAVVITNSSTRVIVGLSVVWDYTDADGKQAHRALKSDSFSLSARRPVLIPGSKLLVTPSTMIPDTLANASSYMAVASSVEQQSALVNSSTTVSAQIDLVIFEDGEVIGADQRHFVAEIQARKAAADSLVHEVRAAPNQTAAMDVLSQTTSTRPQMEDLVGLWKWRYARRLKEAHNLENALRDLSLLPVLPSFYRK